MNADISHHPSSVLNDSWLRQEALQRGIFSLSKLRGPELVAFAHDVYGQRLSVLSAFGTESAVLLSWAAEVDKNMRVLLIDTGKHFPETLAYKEQLVGKLGLTNIRTLRPDAAEVSAEDPDPPSDLWQRARKQCCDLRKVRPLEREVVRIAQLPPLVDRIVTPLRREMESSGMIAILNGIKGLHGGGRADAPNFISNGTRTDFSPLFDYTREEIAAEFKNRGLPPHPLAAKGYTSIGCAPATCTSLPTSDDPRSGRFTDEKHREGAVCLVNINDRRQKMSYSVIGHP